MKRRWPALACLGLLLEFAQITAAPPAPPSAANPAEPLIQNLSHPKYSVRERADRQLREMGTAALDALKANLDKLDAEGRDRAKKLIAAIAEDAFAGRTLSAPKVRLQFDRTPLADALKTVNAKTGLQLAFADRALLAGSPAITLDTGEVPLWEAVDKFEAAAGLTEGFAAPVQNPNNPYAYSGRIQMIQMRGSVTVTGGGGVLPPGANVLSPGQRSVAADLRSAVRIRMLPVSNPVYQKVLGSDEVTIGLEATAPPAAAFRSIVGTDITRAQDDTLQLLQPKLTPPPETGNSGGYYGGFPGGGRVFFRQAVMFDEISPIPEGPGLHPHQTSITLNLGRRTSTRLDILTGNLNAVVLSAEEPILTFDNLVKGGEQEKKAGNFQFQIKEVKMVKKGHWSVRATYESSAADNPQIWRGGWNEAVTDEPNIGGYDFSANNGLPKFAYLDQDGKPIRRTSHNISRQSFQQNNNGMFMNSEILMTILTEGEQVPGQIVLSGRRISLLKIPFELKNVPLP